MRIAQVAPLYESVPPRLYGGTERIVSYLTDELVRAGHEVTLFASGESRTGARLVATCHRSLRLDTSCVDPIPHHLVLLEQVYRMAKQFDIIHFHGDYLHYPFSRRHALPHVTTLHGNLAIPDLVPLYREFPTVPVVSISEAQRRPLPWLNWYGTVLHGIPADLLPFCEKGGDYLAFLGRISPEKGVDTAIRIARMTGVTLKIAAKVDTANADYFTDTIKPLLDGKTVEYVGEIAEGEKQEFLGGASALLFPIDWDEPFGLVMIESMACGTPVIGFPRGSVPEIIRDGLSGFVARSSGEAAMAVERIATLNRRRCRSYFEERFTAPRMAAEYLTVYENVIGARENRAINLSTRHECVEKRIC